MSFFPSLEPLVSKINSFTEQQNLNQQQIIALLKQISSQLSQIQQQLK
jgi:predicted XRE-type DNA-binding protein